MNQIAEGFILALGLICFVPLGFIVWMAIHYKQTPKPIDPLNKKNQTRNRRIYRIPHSPSKKAKTPEYLIGTMDQIKKGREILSSKKRKRFSDDDILYDEYEGAESGITYKDRGYE